MQMNAKRKHGGNRSVQIVTGILMGACRRGFLNEPLTASMPP